ncbi:helix-turn-helix transcriptional regulator [Halomarina halobia]|uniref:Helix-turn-helix transcriptional regulator n=1 Tax=Halomarina halobia TaxID=3033386 RepID=A0ABD6AEA3_9EURY|nr:helix-turn-helix transcriptional regulator [Halomarina sp. PSR21]
MEPDEIAELGVLGILAEEDASLPRIRERLQHGFGRHWTAGHGTLGPTLSRLEGAGRVGRDGETYALTREGRERLLSLLRRPIDDVLDPTQRRHLRMKIGFLHHLPPRERDEELARLEDQFYRAREERTAVYRAHERQLGPERSYRRDMQELTVRLLDVHLEWIRELRDRQRPPA